jgi:hypothetical protein
MLKNPGELTPLLGQEGWMRPLIKMLRSYLFWAQTGWSVLQNDLRATTPSPLLYQEGSFL